MPLNKESFEILDSVKKSGRPCKFVLLYKAGDVISLVAYRKGSEEAKIMEAKQAGHGTPLCGIVDNVTQEGVDRNLSFKLQRTKEQPDAPIAERKLRVFLDQEAKDLKAKPAID